MKSSERTYFELAVSVLVDAHVRCATEVSKRDIQTLQSRIKHEGLSFLTISLPNFCSDLDKALAEGWISPTLFSGFRKRKAIPAFLQGMLRQVFDLETGRLIPHEDSASSVHTANIICGVRQFSLFFKKLRLECTPERVAQAIHSFKEIEHDLSNFSLDKKTLDDFRRVSYLCFGSALSGISLSDLTPRHGPGATADSRSGNGKFIWLRWHDRLETIFPFYGNAYSVHAFGEKESSLVEFVSEDLEQPVKVTTVPKTLKGPRIIAIEPCCQQYAQQGIREALYERLQSGRITSGHINFDDQSVNQALAVEASRTGAYATIDLSEASDRVPHELAREMFGFHPSLWDAIDACRSSSAKLPTGEIISPLRKFASMGSALCFPVEAMYFFSICTLASLEAYNLPITARNVFHVTRSLYVYGDDIVVPTDIVAVVLRYLAVFNCKVNARKSFWTGKFRESCGVDSYDGHQVQPVYLRRPVPESKRQAEELISWVDTANQLASRECWRTASLMFDRVEHFLGKLPEVPSDLPLLGRTTGYRLNSVSSSFTGKSRRYNKRLQRFEVKGWVAQPVYRTDKLDGYAALAKSLLKLESLPSLDASRDPKHLERSARYGAVTLQRRWVAAYSKLLRN